MRVSNLGLSVGQARINGSTSAVSVTPGGAYTQLRALNGDLVSLPFSVNAVGTAVGTSSTDRRYESRLAVFWNRGGVPEPVPGFSRSDLEETTAINDLGVMAGYTKHFEPDGIGSGFVWHTAWPAPRKLDNIYPGMYATAVDINNLGQIAGYSQHPTEGSVVVIWDLQGTATVLGNPAGYNSGSAAAINDFGTIVGIAYPIDASGERAVWTWTKRAGFTMLGMVSGQSNVFVHGIDNAGRVYGGAIANGVTIPLIWIAGRQSVIAPVDGGNVGNRDGSVFAVSRTGIMSGTTTVNGTSHPSIWVPRP